MCVCCMERMYMNLSHRFASQCCINMWLKMRKWLSLPGSLFSEFSLLPQELPSARARPARKDNAPQKNLTDFNWNFLSSHLRLRQKGAKVGLSFCIAFLRMLQSWHLLDCFSFLSLCGWVYMCACLSKTFRNNPQPWYYSKNFSHWQLTSVFDF